MINKLDELQKLTSISACQVENISRFLGVLSDTSAPCEEQTIKELTNSTLNLLKSVNLALMLGTNDMFTTEQPEVVGGYDGASYTLDPTELEEEYLEYEDEIDDEEDNQ